MTDEDLVRAYLSGDEDAFAQLYDRFKDRVFNTAFRITGSYQEALDTSQEIFIKVYRELKRFKFQSKFSTWLYRVAVNISINKINEIKRKARPAGREEAPDRTVNDVMHDERINCAIQKLSEPLQTVVILRYLENLSYDEIADILNIPMGTVKSRLNSAHAELKTLLADVVAEKMVKPK